MSLLISFDIDGTLEVGDPPGLVTMDMVREARRMGYFIGSCSDKPVSAQRAIWSKHEIQVDFTVLKYQLPNVKDQFLANEYYHIGDSYIDRHYAKEAGFQFLHVSDVEKFPWNMTTPPF